MIRNNNAVSFHVAIDDYQAVECIPEIVMHFMQETEETETAIEITMRLKSVILLATQQSSHKQKNAA